MTLNGAIMQLVEMRESVFMPTLFKPALDKVIETISECEEPSADRRRWIPVSEALPEKNKEVLISLEWGVDIGWYDEDGWESEWISHYDDDDILAWQPLPNPYREDGEA